MADALRGVGEGHRDHTCTRLAGYFLKKGIDADTVIALLSESFAKACQPPFDPPDVEKCVRSVARRDAVAGTDRAIAPKHISEVLADFQRALAAGPLPMLPTPFPTLNHFLDGGLGPGELIFVGARPGVGKTALGLEFSRRAARQRTGAVLVLSREMTNLALARRLVAQDARIRASAIKRGTLNETERWSINESVARLTALPLYLVDDAVSLGEIQELVAAIAAEAPLALVVVDYLQLGGRPRVSRNGGIKSKPSARG